jgi:hypothetical protein
MMSHTMFSRQQVTSEWATPGQHAALFAGWGMADSLPGCTPEMGVKVYIDLRCLARLQHQPAGIQGERRCSLEREGKRQLAHVPV